MPVTIGRRELIAALSGAAAAWPLAARAMPRDWCAWQRVSRRARAHGGRIPPGPHPALVASVDEVDRPIRNERGIGRWTNFSSGWASEQRRKPLDRTSARMVGIGLFRSSPVFCLLC